MNVKKLRQAQFYITNVCNLACPDCCSFNNLRFKGHFPWEESSKKISKWRDLLTFEELAILGGEPFSHPELDTWVTNLKALFHEVEDFRITTNATLFKHNIERIRNYINQDIIIECSIHASDQWQHTLNDINTILHGREFVVTEIDQVLYYTSDQKTLFEVRPAWKFLPSSVKDISSGMITFYDSDPVEAHNSCLWKNCHYFVQGNLYKCVVTATTGLLSQQFSINNRHSEIIANTKYADPFDNLDNVLNFIDGIEHHCEQCALCPTGKLEFSNIVIPLKKVKV